MPSADTKITALQAITSVNPAVYPIPIVDTTVFTMGASGTTMKATVNQLLSGNPTAGGNFTITGDLTVRTNKLAVTSTGVGVGTASPTYGFDYAGSVARFINSGSTVDLFLTDSGTTNGYVRLRGESNAMRFITGNGISATLDSSGNLGLGVTPSARFHSKAGAVTLGGIIETGGGNSLLTFADVGTSSYTRVQIGSSGNNLVALMNGTQAMTLDASGNLLVGKMAVGATTVGFQAVGATGVVNSTAASSTDAIATFAVYSTGAAAYRFYVGMGGTVFATNTTISAISDARLKENVQDIDIGLDAILALKPRKFDWKAGKGKDIKGDRGFIAQEFETVFPNLVDEWKDPAPEGEAPYKSVRQDLIPVLVKAIQQLTARVIALENK